MMSATGTFSGGSDGAGASGSADAIESIWGSPISSADMAS